MTKIINILDDLTINKIAAGEVVERPSSVTKELIENSIDASSTQIVIDIVDGGKKQIRITDNGEGIPSSEVDKSFNNDSEEDYVIEETPLFINDSINDNQSEKEQVTMDFKVNEKNEQIKKIEFYPCGLVMGTYIIAQNDDAMYLIDQHAAQERINYEKIRNALYDDKIKTTDLLIPISIELSPSDYLKLQDNKKILTDLGFVINDFGINTIIIKTHPTWLISGYEEENIRRIIDYILEMPKDFDRVRFIDNISATCACKMSVKGNTSITMEEAESILNQLVKCDNPYNCPHGRPTIITFTKYELERLFKRVMN